MEAQARTIRHLEEAAYWKQCRANENAQCHLQGLEVVDIGHISSDIQDSDLLVLTTSVKEYFTIQCSGQIQIQAFFILEPDKKRDGKKFNFFMLCRGKFYYS
jgi:hypothetical protein